MSPAAAEFGSACSAPEPLVVAAVVVVSRVAVGTVTAVVAPGVAVCVAPPQPETIAAGTTRARTSDRKRRPGRFSATDPAAPSNAGCLAADADELRILRGTGERFLADHPDPRRIDLAVIGAGFDPRRLERCQDVLERPVRDDGRAARVDDPSGVLGLPGEELLPVGVRDLRAGFHH